LFKKSTSLFLSFSSLLSFLTFFSSIHSNPTQFSISEIIINLPAFWRETKSRFFDWSFEQNVSLRRKEKQTCFGFLSSYLKSRFKNYKECH
jgi:hypothetical protein